MVSPAIKTNINKIYNSKPGTKPYQNNIKIDNSNNYYLKTSFEKEFILNELNQLQGNISINYYNNCPHGHNMNNTNNHNQNINALTTLPQNTNQKLPKYQPNQTNFHETNMNIEWNG